MSSSINGISGIANSLAALGMGSTSASTDPLAGLGIGSTDGSSSLSKAAFGLTTDEFFSLFLTQLQNQDPTQPVDDKEMVGQLAQFTMIQTLNDVSSALNGSRLAESAGLIGKQVTGYNEVGESITGVVDHVEQTADGFWLVVGEDRIAPDSVSSVTSAPAAA